MRKFNQSARGLAHSIAILGLFLAPQAFAGWALSAEERLPAPEALHFVSRKAVQNGQSVEIYTVSFDPKTHTLAVMDNPAGDFSMATAAAKRGALAAVNGGYFHPDRTPLGLVVRQGKELHSLERARLLSGLMVATKARVSLLRVAEFKPSPAITEALQAGPFLVDASKPVQGLDANRAAARTVIFTDDSGRCGLLVCRYSTLAETAEILCTPGVAGPAKVIRALNLDGGSSTGLWVRDAMPFYLREGKTVRNYVAVIRR